MMTGNLQGWYQRMNKRVISMHQKIIDRCLMMTSSNGNIFRVTGPLCGEFTGHGESPTQRPVTRSFDVFFDLRLNKRLSKQPWGWWFETPLWSLRRHCNAVIGHVAKMIESLKSVQMVDYLEVIISLAWNDMDILNGTRRSSVCIELLMIGSKVWMMIYFVNELNLQNIAEQRNYFLCK